VTYTNNIFVFGGHSKVTSKCIPAPHPRFRFISHITWIGKMKKVKIFLALLFFFTTCSCIFWIQTAERYSVLEKVNISSFLPVVIQMQMVIRIVYCSVESWDIWEQPRSFNWTCPLSS